MLKNVAQRTIRQSVSCSGKGLHTGAPVHLTLIPGAENTGIVFVRTDLEGQPEIPARFTFVRSTRHATTIGLPSGPSVSTIEHVLSALYGVGIDNARILLDGPEVPIMDGSAAPFLFLIECAGILTQKTPKTVLEILKPVSVTQGNRHAELTPAAQFSLSFNMYFHGDKRLPTQTFFFTCRSDSFKSDIASARTFGFFEDVELLHQNGLAQGGSLENAIVFKEGVPLNQEGLRFQDECVRHKILDAIGDLALAAFPIQGHFHGTSSGHDLNYALLKALFNDPTAWRLHKPDTPLFSPFISEELHSLTLS
jgi:UDP-3-O-[3-hydroxymyristoyl] N-acetylglucosamine deacetylase